MTHVDDNEVLFAALKRELLTLLEIRTSLVNDSGIYKFYSQSFKAFRMQDDTETIVAALQAVLPDAKLHPWFMQIVAEGTGHEFDLSMNTRWLEYTRKIIEAFLHARHMLEAAIEVANMPDLYVLPSAWFTIQELYRGGPR